MTMTLHAVRRLIEAFVALMVGAGIPVRWGGIAGVSAAGEIHLPRPVTGEADEVALLTRLAVHEAGHIVHTQAGWDARLTGPERAIFNALEDPRMERAQCLNYPGAAIVLARGLDEMLQEIEQHVATRLATHPERAMQLELLIRGFLLLAPHEPVLRHAPALLATLAPALGPIQHRAVEAALIRLPEAASSLDIEALAKELVAQLQENGTPVVPVTESKLGTRPSGTIDSDDGHGDPGRCTAKSNASDSPDRSNAGSIEVGVLLRGALAKRFGAAAGVGEEAADTDASQRQRDVQQLAEVLSGADPVDSLEQLLERSIAAFAPDLQGAHGTMVQGALGGMNLAGEPASKASPAADTRLEGVQSKLVTVLRRALQDKRRRPGRSAQGGVMVRPERYWRLAALGDTRVMRGARGGRRVDAAVTVLLDSSDSMEPRLQAAADVALAFSLALQRLGVRTRVAHFPGRGAVTETIQRFGESARACVERCAALQANGGTPTGAAVAIEIEELSAQGRPKAMIVVITDDAPGDRPVLAAALQRAAERRVLVIGVGIGSNILDVVPRSVHVRAVDDLPKALGRLFDESISEVLRA